VRCEFEQAGERRSYDLIWAPLPQAEFEAHAKAVAATYRAPVEVRRFANKALWVSAGTFTSDAASEAGKQLEALVGTLNDPATVRDAEVIVLDVRGNGGGSSRWGDRIAAAIWGQKNAEAAKPKSAGVDWRASEANIAALQAFKDSPGSGLGLRVWADHAIKGMKKAKAAGQVYWRETSPVGRLFGGGGFKAARIDPATFNTRAKVYVLADAACASACLDALDVWRALGAVQVGRETSADSLYMEIRQQTLPSGFASLSIPMKVYRGRPRGANEPYRPAHQLDERMSDTAALERRILALAETGG
jgi:hypothetical protein